MFGCGAVDDDEIEVVVERTDCAVVDEAVGSETFQAGLARKITFRSEVEAFMLYSREPVQRVQLLACGPAEKVAARQSGSLSQYCMQTFWLRCGYEVKFSHFS